MQHHAEEFNVSLPHRRFHFPHDPHEHKSLGVTTVSQAGYIWALGYTGEIPVDGREAGSLIAALKHLWGIP